MLDPKYKYNVGDFKREAEYGAASTHGRFFCEECAHYGVRRNPETGWLVKDAVECQHPLLQAPFSLGTHPDRMGCRHGYQFWGNAP